MSDPEPFGVKALEDAIRHYLADSEGWEITPGASWPTVSEQPWWKRWLIRRQPLRVLAPPDGWTGFFATSFREWRGVRYRDGEMWFPATSDALFTVKQRLMTRTWIVLLCLLAMPVWAAPPGVYGDDGEYLGRLTENPYDPEGVRNPYGWYGNPYSGALVNPWSEYRNPYWSDSVENPYAPWGDDGD